ncbi:hypothetical protein KKG41_03160 [Patescibacteria group bacterium]|nr:hypothetical protein [Patescibacteria group bacterium]MBU1890271.1 hypothetical protein [Patescibacteria group bacterium]
MCPAVSIENADVYTDQIIFDDVTNEFPNLPKHKIQELVFTLTAPTSLGYAGREQRDLLKTAIEYKNKAQKTQPRYFKQLETAHPGIARKLYVLSRKYYWVNNNYAATKILTPDYFLNRVKVLSRKPIKQLRNELREIEIRPIQVKNQQSKLRQQLKLSRRMNTIFNLLSEYTIWQDERKEWSMRMSHYILNFWKWWSQNTGVLYQYLIGLGWSEMEKYFKTGKLPSEKELKNRIKFSVYVAERKGKGIVGEVVSGKPARDLFKTILKRFEVGTELQGVVASAPKKVIKGAVQIVTDFSKQKFITGRILVTNMTRPDSMPYVRKSIGIITNEGGVTTHAAIVSRELKIPCIIGTKHATKLLKNGDRVEMDLESGKITILK